MLILPKQTPYYSISSSRGIDFYLSYDGIQYADSDLYLYDLMEDPFNVEYTQLSNNDKVYFAKNIKFPLLTVNRLDDLPIKKVNSKFDKVIVDPKNHNLGNKYYIIKYNDIYYKYATWNTNNLNRFTPDKYPGIEIYKVYYTSKSDQNLLYCLSQYKDKLVHIDTFFNFYMESRPKLDKFSFESIKAMLNSDETNIKLAADLLLQYNYMKYLPDLCNIITDKRTIQYYLAGNKSGIAVLYTCFGHSTIYKTVNHSPFKNIYHELRSKILQINNQVSQISYEYEIQI